MLFRSFRQIAQSPTDIPSQTAPWIVCTDTRLYQGVRSFCYLHQAGVIRLSTGFKADIDNTAVIVWFPLFQPDLRQNCSEGLRREGILPLEYLRGTV